MSTARSLPVLDLMPHPSLKKPKGVLVPNTSLPAWLFDGSPAQDEGFKGMLVLHGKMPPPGPVSAFGELAIKFKYSFDYEAADKAAFFQADFRIIHVGTEFAYDPPDYLSLGALLTQASISPTSPDSYSHEENLQMRLPGKYLQDGDLIVVENFFRDTSHPEDTGHDVHVLDVAAITLAEQVEDEDVYLFKGEATSVAVGASATVDTPISLDVQSPGAFSKKGALLLVEVVASSPPGTSTDFDVEIYEESTPSEIIYKTDASDSSASPDYGLIDDALERIFENKDDPQEKKLYVRIIEQSGNATTFDIRLKGYELK